MDNFVAALYGQLKITERTASKMVPLSEIKALIEGAVVKAKLETVQISGAAGQANLTGLYEKMLQASEAKSEARIKFLEDRMQKVVDSTYERRQEIAGLNAENCRLTQICENTRKEHESFANAMKQENLRLITEVAKLKGEIAGMQMTMASAPPVASFSPVLPAANPAAESPAGPLPRLPPLELGSRLMGSLETPPDLPPLRMPKRPDLQTLLIGVSSW